MGETRRGGQCTPRIQYNVIQLLQAHKKRQPLTRLPLYQVRDSSLCIRHTSSGNTKKRRMLCILTKYDYLCRLFDKFVPSVQRHAVVLQDMNADVKAGGVTF